MNSTLLFTEVFSGFILNDTARGCGILAYAEEKCYTVITTVPVQYEQYKMTIRR